MASYSIKDLEKLTGVKAHTIRIWEQRYELISPQRTDTNIRYYSDEEAKRLLKVSALYHQGMKISKIASLSEAEINEYLIDKERAGNLDNHAMEQLSISMIDLNEELFLQTFAQYVTARGFKETILHLIYPFLQRIGVMWQVGDILPAQEHFISNLIRQKIIGQIDQLHFPKTEMHTKVILFLPEGELHELGLLFYSYLLKDMNYHVLYLGQSVPSEDIIFVAKKYNCTHFVTSITLPSALESFNQTAQLLFQAIPKAQLFVAGSETKHHLSHPSSVHKLTNLQDLIHYFKQTV